MNETIDKLKEYLYEFTTNKNNLKEHVPIRISEDYNKYQDLIDLMSKEHLAKILNISSTSWRYCRLLYTDFGELTRILKDAKFKVKEILGMLIYFMERNLSTGILEVTDIEEAKMRFATLDFTKTVKVTIKTLYPTLQSIPYEFDERSRRKFQNLSVQNAYFNKLEDSILEDIIKYLKILDEHLIRKMPYLEAEDSVLIIQSLKYFGVSREVLDEITGYLITLVNKNKKEDTKPKVVSRYAMPQKVCDRNTKILYKELANYYDITNNKGIRVLSLEEELYVVYLMQELELSTDIINEALENIHKLSSNNPISLYARLYPKYISFQDIPEVKESLSTLNIYFSQLFICDSEEYAIIKMCFEEEFNNLLKSIPQDYSYEYNNARSLKK